MIYLQVIFKQTLYFYLPAQNVERFLITSHTSSESFIDTSSLEIMFN